MNRSYGPSVVLYLVAQLIGQPIAGSAQAQPPPPARQSEPAQAAPAPGSAAVAAQNLADYSVPEGLLNPSEEEAREIASLIEELMNIDSPDYGLSATLSGSAFAPVAQSGRFAGGILMDHQLKTADAFRRLVALGPRSLPQLLRSLGDSRTTKLVITHDFAIGGMWHAPALFIRPGCAREEQMLAAHPRLAWSLVEDDHTENLTEYTVTVGDVCFVAVGQITGRAYQAIRYQPTACTIINSPTQCPDLAAAVRDLWGGDRAGRVLLDSLLCDFLGQGGDCGEPDRSSAALAARRLLYYFPDSAPAWIAQRLDGLDVKGAPWPDPEDAWSTRLRRNGVDAAELASAVAFSDDDRITASITAMALRTDDPMVLEACLTERVVARNGPGIMAKLQEVIAVAPIPGQGPYGPQYKILLKSTALYPRESRRLFDLYLRHDTLPCRRAVIAAIDRSPGKVAWSAEFLLPLLDDKMETGWSRPAGDLERYPLRVCEEAAQAIARHTPESDFILDGPPDLVDRQIAELRELLTRARPSP